MSNFQVDSQSSYVLSEKQIDRYNKEGAIVIHDLVSADQVTWMIEPAMKLYEEHAHPDIPGRVDSASNWEPDLVLNSTVNRMIDVAEQLLGGPVICFGDWLLDKRPGQPESVWHQDEWRRQQRWNIRYVETWLAINDTNEANGCLQTIPYSHKQGLVKRPSDEFESLVGSDPMICEMSSGGCIFFDGLTLHYAGFNTSGKPRLAYSISFGRLQNAEIVDFLITKLIGEGSAISRDQFLQLIVESNGSEQIKVKDVLQRPALFRAYLSDPVNQKRFHSSIMPQVNKILQKESQESVAMHTAHTKVKPSRSHIDKRRLAQKLYQRNLRNRNENQ